MPMPTVERFAPDCLLVSYLLETISEQKWQPAVLPVGMDRCGQATNKYLRSAPSGTYPYRRTASAACIEVSVIM